MDFQRRGGYACFANRGEDIYGCTSLVTEDTVMTLLSVDFQTTSDSSTTVYNVASGTITTTILALSNSIQAYGVIVERWVTQCAKRIANEQLMDFC